MRLLHVHDIPRFEGGVEQILYDTALGLAECGWSQALLHSDGQSPDSKFLSAFSSCDSSADMIARFRPHAILMHKVADRDRVDQCSKTAPTLHMVHDHDLYCPRRHKYFPLSKKICTKPAGAACYQHLCCIQRAPADSILPVRLSGTGAVNAMLDASTGIRRYIVGSHYMKEQLKLNGISEEKISIVNPVPAALASPRYIAMQQQPEILFVGQVIRGKGVDLLLRALAKVSGPWKAKIVGTGTHLEACKQLASKLNIAGRVVFTGRIDHEKLESYYAAARVVVVPSRWPEPFGMVGIEAMSRGRPVVAFGSGGISDWLDDQVTGLLVPPADISELAKAVQHLLDNPEIADHMGRRAADHVEQSFSHNNYLDQMKETMESLR